MDVQNSATFRHLIIFTGNYLKDQTGNIQKCRATGILFVIVAYTKLSQQLVLLDMGKCANTMHMVQINPS